MSESEIVLKSFTSFIESIEKETRILKCLTNIRDVAPNSSTAMALHDLNDTVTSLEEDIDVFEAWIDEELENMRKCEELRASIELESNHINDIEILLKPQILESSKKNTAEVIAIASMPSTVPIADTVIQSNGRKEAFSIEISEDKFDKVSKSTRGRLTLEQLNHAFKVMRSMETEKAKKFRVKRPKMTSTVATAYDEYMSKLTSEHGNSTYLTEAELRASPVFEAGESTGRTVLATLRALQRLRMVRSGKENTYVIQ